MSIAAWSTRIEIHGAQGLQGSVLWQEAQVSGVSIRVNHVDVGGVFGSQSGCDRHVELVEGVGHVVAEERSGGVHPRNAIDFKGEVRIGVGDEVLAGEGAGVCAQAVADAMDVESTIWSGLVQELDNSVHGLADVPLERKRMHALCRNENERRRIVLFRVAA